ncbi:surface antigen [Aestuariispira insulae]|uniref:Surface antigen n=2 Tax=Aestuariispira insulae TaxID=1461337 RepID=A0A3D9HXB0_9PROT|nr:surface antigen [Aestuariispira insulae]
MKAMSNSRMMVAAMLVVAPLSGCVTDSNLSREDRLASGTGLGMLAGGLLGYSMGGGDTAPIIGMLVGAGAGGVAGYWATDRLTRWDKSAMNDTAFQGLNESSSGQTLTWANQDSGNSGSFTPVRTFLDAKGRICRDFVVTLDVDGTPREGERTACRTATGDWVML